MCQFEAPKQEGKSDEARVRMRQEAQEAGAGDFCSGRATDVAKAAEDMGGSKPKKGGAMKRHENEVAGPGNRQTITRKLWRAD